MIEAAVVDASVAAKWVLDEAGSDKARLLSEARLEAPDLLLVECANILWKKVVLGDLNREGALSRLELISQAPITLSPAGSLLPTALRLSIDLKHPIYDCVYLALAVRRRIPLVTADHTFVESVRRRRKLSQHILRLDKL